MSYGELLLGICVSRNTPCSLPLPAVVYLSIPLIFELASNKYSQKRVNQALRLLLKPLQHAMAGVS